MSAPQRDGDSYFWPTLAATNRARRPARPAGPAPRADPKTEWLRAISILLYGIAVGIAAGGAITMLIYGASARSVITTAAQGVLWLAVFVVQTHNRLRP